MAGTAIALRYAEALDGVVTEQGLDSNEVQRQLRDFAATFAGSPQLREVMEDPSLPATEKLAVLDALASRLGARREVRNFLALTVEHGRTAELPAIVEEYHGLANASSGVVEAEVTTVHELNGPDRDALEWEISRLAVSRVRVSYRQDPALLGGAVVRIGSTVYDGSVRGQLEQMKQQLTAQ